MQWGKERLLQSENETMNATHYFNSIYSQLGVHDVSAKDGQILK